MSPPKLRLTRLALTQFRNYSALTWYPRAAVTVLSGPNGGGKTNLLEAISLLVPGRGLRGARIADLARVGPGATGAWAVAGRFATPQGGTEIGTGTPQQGASDRRVFRLDGAVPRSQAAVAEHVAAVWITPSMDRLFVENAGARRRFLDRLVYALHPGHAREVAAHETAVASRNRLLASEQPDPAWLGGVEHALARHAVAVTAARAQLVARLDSALAGGLADPFPAARLSLSGEIADRLARWPALEVEDWLRHALAAARRSDAGRATTSLGAHRADFLVADAATGLAAARASTGQQKALLLALVLGHAALLAAARAAAPLLLLDEVAVHLDTERREALFAALVRLPAQAFLTGTDNVTFTPLRGIAEGMLVQHGTLRPDPGF